MTKSLKLIIGCACALILLAACTDENAYYQTADSVEESKPEVVRTQDHLVCGKVVFHEYVPSDHIYIERPYNNAIEMHYTEWIPTTIIEYSGMRKRFEDQTTYELYQLGDEPRITVTDGFDAEGNVTQCDFRCGWEEYNNG